MLMPAAPPIQALFSETISHRQMTVIDAPDLAYFLTEEDVPQFKWNRPFEKAKLEPFVGLQTSGTTGIPKPVIMTHAMMTAMDAQRRLPSLGLDPIAFASFEGKRVLSSFPFFHGAGLGLAMSTIIFPSTIIYPPPQPVHAKLVVDLMNQRGVETAALPPWTIAEIATEPEGLKALARLDHLYYGGGPLPTSACETVSPVTHLVAGFGTSEVGHYPVQMLSSEDVPYLKFSPLWGCRMFPELDGLYELVMVRDAALEDYQSVFTTFPELQQYATRDLFSPHPTKEGLWRFEGRKDDIIVLSNGEKFNPITLEDAVNGNPNVKAVLVVGTGQFQSALLIEPVEYPATDEERQKLVEQVWPVVQKENRRGVSTGRVLKDMILIGASEKPFPRAGKGTVQRRQTEALYAQEIAALYNMAHDCPLNPGTPLNGESMSLQQVENTIIKAVQSTCGVSLKLEDNLLDHGLDSLGIMSLLRELRQSLSHGISRSLTARHIYEAENISTLAQQLVTSRLPPVDKLHIMQRMYEKAITGLLPITSSDKNDINVKRKVFLLTGSTGTFGSYLLDRLLHEDSTAEIICIHRGGESAEHQIKSIQEKRSASLRAWIQKPVSFIPANLSKSDLGLSQHTYQSLLQKVTHIVHNAWQVNFNLPVEQFEKTHIHGVRELVDFSARSKHTASIAFISSISAVSAWRPEPNSAEREIRRIPERFIDDWAAAEDTGYSQSKLVAERVLATAGEKCNIPCSIFRLGQIAGPSVGDAFWPRQEWFPSILISSKYLGVLPSSLGKLSVIDWIPVDFMAEIVCDWLSHEWQPEAWQCVVRHGVNPSKVTYQDVLPHLKVAMGLEDIPIQEWLGVLSEGKDMNMEKNPARRLLDFFGSLGNVEDRGYEFTTSLSMQGSKTLTNLQPVDTKLVDVWLRQLGLIQKSR